MSSPLHRSMVVVMTAWLEVETNQKLLKYSTRVRDRQGHDRSIVTRLSRHYVAGYNSWLAFVLVVT